MSRSSFLRSGLTLIEVLVVIGILLVILSLSLPVVMRLREIYNNSVCLANLHNIGQAFGNFTRGDQPYPMGGASEPTLRRTLSFHVYPFGDETPTTREKQNWGWAYQILPELELEIIWKKPEYFPLGKKEMMTYEYPVKSYFCPSRAGTRMILSPHFRATVAGIDYAGNGGHLSYVNPTTGVVNWDRNANYPFPYTSTNVPHSGIIGVSKSYRYGKIQIDSLLRPSEVFDGYSYTLLIGEKRINSGLLVGNASQPGDELGYCSGFSTDTVRTGAYPPLRDETDQNFPVFDGFGSSHPSGFNALMADGSARKISYRIGLGTSAPSRAGNLTVMQRLCHRSDGGSVLLDSD